MTIDIICAVFNGARYLPDFLSSLQRQTHGAWRLWVRDDGSSDDTVAVVRRFANEDSRIQLLIDDQSRRGVTGSFGWLLEHVPNDADYVMFADQDDVWLDNKVERTLAEMRAAEAAAAGGDATPILVHTDLTVVNEQLHPVHASFWEFAGINPDASSLRRIVVRNVTTGATVMLNQSLCRLVGSVPTEAIFHDWWCACVAAAFGRIVAIRESTMLYRQHGTNAVGARQWDVPLRELARTIIAGIDLGDAFRQGVELTATQTRALLTRYGDRLSDDDRRFLLEYSRIPSRGFLRRKIDLFRLRTWPEQGVLRRIGVVLRG